jgi:hypothetical protein
MKLAKSGIQKFLIPVALFALNSILIYPLFTGEYTQHIGSIECAFLSDAKFIVENYPNLNWNPQWYCGFPFHLFYTPLIPYLIAFFNILFPALSIAKGYRLLTAVMYALGPVTLYLFVKYLTKREFPALLTALLYSLVPSFLFSTLPLPSRLAILTFYGEGPHISGLTVTPIAALTFLHAIRKPEFKNYVSAGLTIALVALLNLIALYGLALILAVIFLSEIVLGNKRRKLKSAVWCGLIAYGLSAFQYDISFISASATFGGFGNVTFSWVDVVVATMGLPILLALLSYLFSNRPMLQPWLICTLWVTIFSAIILAWYLFKLAIAPQPIRYSPELEMGLAILLGLTLTVFGDFLSRLYFSLTESEMSYNITKIIFTSILLLILVSISLPINSSLTLTQPSTNITETAEYKLATWLAPRIKDERVYATGTIAFWLNVFSNIPQLRGGSDQAATNPWWDHVTYQINTGPNGTLAVLWAKALNIKYIVVNYPNASTTYIDYIYPQKFEKLLPLRHFYNGFAIFEVPIRNPALVQPVDASKFMQLEPISNVLDAENLRNYVELIEAPAIPVKCDYQIENADKIIVRLQNSTQKTGVLVKMTFDERWKAYVDGRTVPVTPVGPYFMLVNADKQGAYEIDLICERTLSEIFGLTITVATIISLMVYSTRRILRGRKFAEK